MLAPHLRPQLSEVPLTTHSNSIQCTDITVAVYTPKRDCILGKPSAPLRGVLDTPIIPETRLLYLSVGLPQIHVARINWEILFVADKRVTIDFVVACLDFMCLHIYIYIYIYRYKYVVYNIYIYIYYIYR